MPQILTYIENLIRLNICSFYIYVASTYIDFMNISFHNEIRPPRMKYLPVKVEILF
jgi:hypothetical protein